MMRKLVGRNQRFIAAVILGLLCGAASIAHASCPINTPSDLEVELKAAIDNLDTPTVTVCGTQWTGFLDPTFRSWGVGGSLNLPVVSAAVGLYRTPYAIMLNNPTNYQITYVDWWITFLSSQTGQPVPNPPPTSRPILRYFKGTEQFSNIYDASVVTSVIAVRYWTVLNLNSPQLGSVRANQLIDFSQRYLRANWAIYGMAAGTGPAWTYDLPGRAWMQNPRPQPTPPGTMPAANTEYNPFDPRRRTGGYLYSGHFLALAGARSKLSHWHADDKFPLFDRAIEYTPAQSNENPAQKDILVLLQQKWPALQARRPGENLYGLTATDRQNINTLVQNGSNASSFLPWLTDIRTATTYRIIGWDGFRASSMAVNTNGNDPNMYGISYRASDQTATFLYPWSDRNGAGAYGWCRLDPGLMTASNEPGTANHPMMTVSMALPTTTPQFHLVLSQNAPPYLESTPPPSFPPREPPVIDWPRNP